MSGGKNRHGVRDGAGLASYGRRLHKTAALQPDERDLALRLRAQRMNWDGVARATGRSVPDLRAELDPSWKD